jgi:hypothetical protein
MHPRRSTNKNGRKSSLGEFHAEPPATGCRSQTAHQRHHSGSHAQQGELVDTQQRAESSAEPTLHKLSLQKPRRQPLCITKSGTAARLLFLSLSWRQLNFTTRHRVRVSVFMIFFALIKLLILKQLIRKGGTKLI